jgi:hypothetical protein
MHSMDSSPKASSSGQHRPILDVQLKHLLIVFRRPHSSEARVE